MHVQGLRFQQPCTQLSNPFPLFTGFLVLIFLFILVTAAFAISKLAMGRCYLISMTTMCIYVDEQLTILSSEPINCS